MNLMLIGVGTRKIGRAVRLPEGPLPCVDGDGTSKSAASRRFVALSQQRLQEWLASDIPKHDLLVIQIDGLHVAEDNVLIGAIGSDGNGDKHILGLVEGATESAAGAKALLYNLIERGLVHKARNIAERCTKKHVPASAGHCARRGSSMMPPKRSA